MHLKPVYFFIPTLVLLSRTVLSDLKVKILIYYKGGICDGVFIF